MHNHANGFTGLEPGRGLGPLEITISAEANTRFWAAAGIEHRAARAGVLYPPIGVQLAIMLTRATVAPSEVLHAAQTLVCHDTAPAGTPLVTTATVHTRYEKRGRNYVEIDATTLDGQRDVRLWSGRSTFVELT